MIDLWPSKYSSQVWFLRGIQLQSSIVYINLKIEEKYVNIQAIDEQIYSKCLIQLIYLHARQA